LNVFKTIVLLPSISRIGNKELAECAAVAINDRSNDFDQSCVASHIAQKRSQQLFVPLIEQLCTRGAFIMKRLADIAFGVMESRKENKRIASTRTPGDELQKLKGFSYFVGVCRDIFCEYIYKTSQLCMEKCMDEIDCTQLVYWESSVEQVADVRADSGTENPILLLTKHIFEEMRNTIYSNVLLKAHNYFLVVMQRDLSGEILKEVSSFDDKLVEDMFELHKSKEQLRVEEDIEKTTLASLTQKETELRDLTSQFTRFKLNS